MPSEATGEEKKYQNTKERKIKLVVHWCLIRGKR
jgi:hypothetical protein